MTWQEQVGNVKVLCYGVVRCDKFSLCYERSPMIPSPLTARDLAVLVGVPNNPNVASVALGLECAGEKAGLNQPHRLVQYLAQLSHESGGFRHDREVWGPTPAQKRYDSRTDLGNTRALDGDGFKYRGRTGIQITGMRNVLSFRNWCRDKISLNAPDFVDNPDLMNTDPWEGLGPIWYWDTNGLNSPADMGDIEMVTRRINGGLNGYEDRCARYVRIALTALDRDPTKLKQFQSDFALKVDGVAGSKTRHELHRQLIALPRVSFDSAHPLAVIATIPRQSLWGDMVDSAAKFLRSITGAKDA